MSTVFVGVLERWTRAIQQLLVTRQGGSVERPAPSVATQMVTSCRS